MKDNEKTVGVAVSASCAALYDQFPHFKTDAKTFQTGMSPLVKYVNFCEKNINKRASALAIVIFFVERNITEHFQDIAKVTAS